MPAVIDAVKPAPRRIVRRRRSLRFVRPKATLMDHGSSAKLGLDGHDAAQSRPNSPHAVEVIYSSAANRASIVAARIKKRRAIGLSMPTGHDVGPLRIVDAVRRCLDIPFIVAHRPRVRRRQDTRSAWPIWDLAPPPKIRHPVRGR